MATTVNTRRRRFVTTMTAFLAVSIISVASAAWLANGDGSGYVKAGTSEDLGTVAATSSEDLVPNTTADVVVSVTNPNPFAVDLTDIEQSTGAEITSNQSGCDASNHDVTFTDLTDITAGTYVIPANSPGFEITLPNAVDMQEDSANECQSAVFTIPVDLEGVSVQP